MHARAIFRKINVFETPHQKQNTCFSAISKKKLRRGTHFTFTDRSIATRTPALSCKKQHTPPAVVSRNTKQSYPARQIQSKRPATEPSRSLLLRFGSCEHCDNLEENETGPRATTCSETHCGAVEIPSLRSCLRQEYFLTPLGLKQSPRREFSPSLATTYVFHAVPRAVRVNRNSGDILSTGLS